MFNTDYLSARKLVIPTIENVNLVLIGCGGTGSWLAPSVVRFARLLVEKFDRDVKLTFVDPDRVEPKNVYRQNFCDAEIGAYKAQTLATRYGLAWGMPIGAVLGPFQASLALPHTGYSAETLTILIGCVDNTAARCEMEKFAYNARRNETIWWLDCGNKKTQGQVLLGRAPTKGENPLLFDGFCSWAPLPSVQEPDLVAEPDWVDESEPDETGLSCAELAMRGSQSLTINLRMAASAAEMLSHLLLTNDLEYFATYIAESVGETRRFLSEKAIERYFKQESMAPNADTPDDTDFDEYEEE